jgi:cytochrome c oxidase subunit 2
LQGGQIVTADRQYLRDSILLPNKQICAGFAPVMPTYQGQLTEDQVNQLVAYIISLRDRQTPPERNSSP